MPVYRYLSTGHRFLFHKDVTRCHKLVWCCILAHHFSMASLLAIFSQKFDPKIFDKRKLAVSRVLMKYIWTIFSLHKDSSKCSVMYVYFCRLCETILVTQTLLLDTLAQSSLRIIIPVSGYSGRLSLSPEKNCAHQVVFQLWMKRYPCHVGRATTTSKRSQHGEHQSILLPPIFAAMFLTCTLDRVHASPAPWSPAWYICRDPRYIAYLQSTMLFDHEKL